MAKQSERSRTEDWCKGPRYEYEYEYDHITPCSSREGLVRYQSSTNLRQSFTQIFPMMTVAQASLNEICST